LVVLGFALDFFLEDEAFEPSSDLRFATAPQAFEYFQIQELVYSVLANAWTIEAHLCALECLWIAGSKALGNSTLVDSGNPLLEALR
jgi:hypothetical protein